MWSRGTMALIMEFSTTCKPAGRTQTCSWENPNTLTAARKTGTTQTVNHCRPRALQSRFIPLCSVDRSVLQPPSQRTHLVRVRAHTRTCATSCTHVSSGSNIGFNFWLISPPAHSITIYTWSSGYQPPPPSLFSLVQVLTGYSRHQSQRSEHSECPQSLDIEACRLPSDGGGAIPLGGLLQDRTEQPEQRNIRNVIVAPMQIWEGLKQRATDRYLIPSAATGCVDFSMCCHQAKVHLHLLEAQWVDNLKINALWDQIFKESSSV